MILASPVNLEPLLEQAGTISPKDVLNFRREVFHDGLVSKVEADAIFMINDLTTQQCTEWHDFFVESLTDFTIQQVEPRGYVSVDNAEWLIRQVTKDDRIKGASELEMLVKTIEKADQCPNLLVNFVMTQVAIMVVTGEGPLIRGKKLVAGVIGEPEVEILRRVLYGFSSEGGIAISKSEAEILFELNDQTIEIENHPSWNDLFVKAIANYLMAVSGYQAPDRKTAFAREQWVEDTQIDVAGTLKKSLTSFSSLFSGGGFKDAFKSDHQRVEEVWEDKNAQFERDTMTAERIDQDEAHWLVDRIGRDGVFHENEKALIRFLKDDSPSIHPALEALLHKAA